MKSDHLKNRKSFPDEVSIKSYLLGMHKDSKLTGRIEENIILNENFFFKILLAEDTLIEDFLEGVLNVEEKKCFVENFLVYERRIENLKLIRGCPR